MSDIRFFIAAIWLLVSGGSLAAASNTLINWESWSKDVFERAAAENKLVLLEMEAVWCHWCHVMDRETYSQQQVADYIHEHYIPVRVDHDARPDLANRYREWGWPATIILNGAGEDLVKRAGYIAPKPFLRLLKAVVKDPTPERNGGSPLEPSAASSSLPRELRSELEARFLKSSDLKLGGLKIAQKFIEPGALDYALYLTTDVNQASADAEHIASLTLKNAVGLLDPAWGGIYQYSTRGNWRNPHYEKLTSIQARYLRLYSLGAKVFANKNQEKVAEEIVRYVSRFLLAPSGAFYTSQDADLIPGEKAHDYFALKDKSRVAQGTPRVDKSIYARENGLMIEALLSWYKYLGKQLGLDMAMRSMKAIQGTHKKGGGYSHSGSEGEAKYLEDNLAVARAFLAFYEVTAERNWLKQADGLAEFIYANFRHVEAGWLDVAGEDLLRPRLGIDINVSTGRFFNKLYHYTGKPKWRDASEHAMRFLSASDVALSRIEDSGILLFDIELSKDPIHYTIVADKDSELALQFYLSALQDPVDYKRVEWLDRSEGPLMNDDVPYPAFDQPAAYVCTDNRCSAPAFDLESWELRRTGLFRSVND